MKRNIIINATLGLVGAGLVLASLVLATTRNTASAERRGTVNLRAAGESYRSRVEVAKNLLSSDSPFAELGSADGQ